MEATRAEQLQERAAQTAARLQRAAELLTLTEIALLHTGLLLQQSAPLAIRGQVDTLLHALHRPPTEHE